MSDREVKIDMDFWGAWPWVSLIVLCWGDPDLLDALISYFKERGACK